MDNHHNHDHDSCCASVNNFGVQQSLSEMEFERGIWYAAQYNDLDRVKALLTRGILVNVEDSAGYRPLHYSARNGHYEVCETLLLYGADVNACTRSGRVTALHRAATQGHVNIVKLLLRFRADPNLKDSDGYTALHRALIMVHVPICKLLIPCTDLSAVDNAGQSIRYLVEKNCADVLPLLNTYQTKDEN